jgi:DNA invertase Pin-like site-specific DNA recombinase
MNREEAMTKRTKDRTESAAVLYARVSSDEQAEGGVSLAVQEEKARQYCALAGLEVAGIYKEETGVSAFKALSRRPEGAKLLKALAEKKARHVVAYSQSRLFRNAADAIGTADTWTRKGITLHLIEHGGQPLNLGSATGKLMWNMTACVDQYHRDVTGERTSDALKHKKQRQEVYSPEPYGTKRNGDALEKDARESEIIRRMAKMRKRGKSYRAIATALNDEGVPTKQGKHWYASTVRYILTQRGKD